MKSNNLKKVITGITALCIMATMSMGVSAMSFPGQQLKGDLNSNNTIDTVDVLEMKKVVLGITQLNGREKDMADMNGDRTVDIIDLVMLKNSLLANQNPDVTTTTEPDVTTTPVDTTTTTTATTEAPVVVQDAVKFTFSQDSVTAYDADGNEVDSQMVNGTTVTITVPEEYTFDGSCDEGQIIVNVDKTTYVDGEVTLNLAGLTLSNTSTSPIYIESIDKECVISSKKGTTNLISDGTSYTNADGGVGAIYSKDDLKFKGKGQLTVNGNCEDGIVSKNDIKIWNSTLNVNAVDDGIRGKDAVKIGDPDDLTTDGAYDNLVVNVKTTSGDGIKSTNYEDEGKGKVNINGGTITINAYADGIQAEQEINIAGGTLDITTTTPASSSGNSGSQWGGPNGGQDGNSSSTETSAKGIKVTLDDSSTLSVEEALNITGGNITVNSTDDSIHSNGNINITGGTMSLTSGDDGVHADNVLTLGTANGSNDDFTIEVNNCYEGIEAYDIEVYSGTTAVLYASDDGFNAAGGNDSSGNNDSGWSQGGWGGGGMSSSTGVINIYGGYLYSRAEGDGFDSNGSITMNGGTLLVCGPTSGGNGIFDKGDGNYSFTFNGGVIFGMGTTDMQDYPNSTLVEATGSLTADKLIAIADGENGNVLSVLKVPSDMNMNSGAVVYSNTASGTYNAYTVDESNYSGTIDKYGYGEGGTITNGTQLSGSSGGGNNRPW